MPEKTINTIAEMLNKEKWTRATLNDFAVSSFQELDDLLKKILSDDLQEEVLALCETHLEHAKNSIIALYISGIVSLNKHQIDDTYLLNLISIFSENHKWIAVEYICRRILDFGENKDALRTLADTLEYLNRPNERYEIWQRLIKVDFEETDIVKSLAGKKEEEGNLDEAILYYRKALQRYANKNQFNQIRDIWKKLVDHGIDDYEFFFLIERKIAKSMPHGKAVILLEELYPSVKAREDWATAIEILKRILNYDGRNNWGRKEIIECYKSRYADHSQVDECIKLSNLNQNWRNVLEAIADFEKHISFDSGSFVFHKNWGVGIIKKIKDNTIVIDFTKKRDHSMSLKMAVGALQSLSRDHIWVLKSKHSKEKLKAKIKQDIPWALKTIIRSFGNVADVKKIKDELVPTILTSNEWTTWSLEARRILKTDSIFGNVPDELDLFVVRERPMSYEEKTFNQFKAETNFFKKVQYVRDFLEYCGADSDFFGEMFAYFTSILKTGSVTPQVVASFLFVQKLSPTYPFLNPGLEWNFNDLWQDIENPVELFSQIEDGDLRKLFLAAVKNEIEDWHTVYISLFPTQLSRTMLDELLHAGYLGEVLTKLEEMVEHYREYREGLIWIARHIYESTWPSDLALKSEKIFINIILLLELTSSEIESKRDLSRNRRLNRQIQNFLFKEEKLKDFILNGDKLSIARIFALLEEIKGIDPVIKRDLKTLIHKQFPKIRLYGDQQETEPTSVSTNRYFFTSKSSLASKRQELNNIIEVEIPKNSKEIGAAIELGDLSENAEYKAGKEKQESLQIQAGKLKDELERARVFTEDDREEGKVGFGTMIALRNLNDSKKETYTILGPWESDPSRKTISYLSPFGTSFLGKCSGDTLKFKINDRDYNFTIESVTPVKLD